MLGHPSLQLRAHVAETHSIEGKKDGWKMLLLRIFQKCHPRMLTESASCRRVDFKNCKQHSMENFFQASLGILAGKSPGYRYRCWLRFWSRSRNQNFRAYFRGILTTSPGHRYQHWLRFLSRFRDQNF